MQQKHYFRTIILCDSPLYDYYQYKDIFQIYPLVDERIKPGSTIRQVPMYLEYWIDLDKLEKKSDEMYQGDNRETELNEAQNNHLKELLRQLTTYTTYHFFVYDY